jgi:hypothetical protein
VGAPIAVIADIARDRKSKTYHGGAETPGIAKIGEGWKFILRNPQARAPALHDSPSHSLGSTIPVCFWYFPDLSL